MNDWQDRIGSDLWKNLLTEECNVVSSLHRVLQGEAKTSHEVFYMPPTPPPDKADRVILVMSVDKANGR